MSISINQMEAAIRGIEEKQAIYKAANNLTVVFEKPIVLEYETVISVKDGVCLCEDGGRTYTENIQNMDGDEIIILWKAAKAQEAAKAEAPAPVAPAKKDSAKSKLFKTAHASAKKAALKAKNAGVSYRELFAFALKMQYATQRVSKKTSVQFMSI